MLTFYIERHSDASSSKQILALLVRSQWPLVFLILLDAHVRPTIEKLESLHSHFFQLQWSSFAI